MEQYFKNKIGEIITIRTSKTLKNGKYFYFEILKVKRLIARCDERNIPSERVMQKIGLKLLWEHGYRKYPNTCEEATEKMYYEDNKD